MRSSYTFSRGIGKLAIIDLTDLTANQIELIYSELMPPSDRPLYLINRVSVPEKLRGRGIAKQLLNQVCNDADNEQANLVLEFAPYSNTDPVRLRNLYESFGFLGCGDPMLDVMYRLAVK